MKSKAQKRAPEVTDATLENRSMKNQELHFSSFKNPFNLLEPRIVRVSNAKVAELADAPDLG